MQKRRHTSGGQGPVCPFLKFSTETKAGPPRPGAAGWELAQEVLARNSPAQAAYEKAAVHRQHALLPAGAHSFAELSYGDHVIYKLKCAETPPQDQLSPFQSILSRLPEWVY